MVPSTIGELIGAYPWLPAAMHSRLSSVNYNSKIDMCQRCMEFHHVDACSMYPCRCCNADLCCDHCLTDDLQSPEDPRQQCDGCRCMWRCLECCSQPEAPKMCFGCEVEEMVEVAEEAREAATEAVEAATDAAEEAAAAAAVATATKAAAVEAVAVATKAETAAAKAKAKAALFENRSDASVHAPE